MSGGTAVTPSKQSLRSVVRARLATLTADMQRERSAAIAERLSRDPAFAEAAAVLLYLPMRTEVDPTAITERAWALGKRVAVPRVDRQEHGIRPVELRGLDEPMEKDAVGVRVPARRRPVSAAAIDLVVTPGLAFDDGGRRLGRGGGYYDRFLREQPVSGRVCGIAFDLQRVEEVPADPSDVAMDMVVTDREVFRFDGGSRDKP